MEPQMIVRIWCGFAEGDNAHAYHQHVTGSVFPGLKAIPGHLGAYLLRRDNAGRVEFLAVTHWESIDAIKRFAGDTPSVAVVEPEARTVLVEFDDFVSTYEVAHGPEAAAAIGSD
jgi:heme-degrading monooxygenase HmoA